MELKIDNVSIGDQHPCFIIAELSANHNQDISIALKTIEAAKEAGADAIKLQTYTPDTITLKSDKEYFQIKHGTIWDGATLYDLYGQAFTPWEWHQQLFDYAKKVGIVCFSSPFDNTAVDLLEQLHAPAYKIASPEITDIPLIKYVAKKGKPIILSSGIANLSDIELAVRTCREAGNNNIIILKCTSEYPTPYEKVNLRTMQNMRSTFQTLVGLSDHTLGISVPVASVALGGCLIEKHFILDRSIGGPDAKFSLDRQQFSNMVTSVREAEKSLGSVNYELDEQLKRIRQFSRSLFVVEDIKKGEIITKENVRSIRPGHGLHPKYLSDVIGRTAVTNIEKGTPLNWELICK